MIDSDYKIHQFDLAKSLLFVYFAKAFGMMLFGMSLYRRFFNRSDVNLWFQLTFLGLGIGIIIVVELAVYFIIRFIVIGYEQFHKYFKKTSKRRLFKQINNCDSYEEYKRVAKQLDELENREKWKLDQNHAIFKSFFKFFVLFHLKFKNSNKIYFWMI